MGKYRPSPRLLKRLKKKPEFQAATGQEQIEMIASFKKKFNEQQRQQTEGHLRVMIRNLPIIHCRFNISARVHGVGLGSFVMHGILILLPPFCMAR